MTIFIGQCGHWLRTAAETVTCDWPRHQGTGHEGRSQSGKRLWWDAAAVLPDGKVQSYVRPTVTVA
jgi:hypothetical protein